MKAIYQQPEPPAESDAELLYQTYCIEQQIKDTTEHLNELQAERDRRIGALIKRNITEAGNYELLTKARVDRQINSERFAALFPEQFDYIRNMEITRAKANAGKKITIKVAESLLGADTIAPACDMITRVTYAVQKKYIDGTEDGI